MGNSLEIIESRDGRNVVRSGASKTQEELTELCARQYPSKPFCLVEQWTLFRVDVSSDDLAKIQAAGHLPHFAFAHKVIHDSRGRFQPGDWVRSSMAISFDGVMFETKNTVYVLMGEGQERVASLKTIFSFF
jgi:hypothetical protein